MKQEKKEFYLAHPFLSRHKVHRWELEFEKEFPHIALFNPFYDPKDPDGLAEIVVNADGSETQRTAPFHVLVEEDLAHLANSRGLVGIIDENRTYGTTMEIVYAVFYDLPVTLVITNGQELHPFLQYHADHIYTSWDEFVAAVRGVETRLSNGVIG